MRLFAFFAAVAVLFALTDTSAAQTSYATAVAGPALAQTAPQSARAAGLRLLTWPGKVAEAPRPRPRPRSAWNTASATVMPPRDTAPQAAALQAAAPQPRRIWNPLPAAPQAAAQPAQAALPANIYAPAPPPAAPVRQASAAPSRAATPAASPSDGDYQRPHFYSLYREYGQTPDPIPLNPQFFASTTPDLAQPPPPVPRTVTVGGRVIQQASPSPDDTPG